MAACDHDEASAARLDERVQGLMRSMDCLREELRGLTGQSSPFVTKTEFWAIKLTVYGIWGGIGTAVLSALLALVLLKAGG